MLGISSVQPFERFVGLVPESINLGDLYAPIAWYFAIDSLNAAPDSLDFRQSVLRPLLYHIDLA